MYVENPDNELLKACVSSAVVRFVFVQRVGDLAREWSRRIGMVPPQAVFVSWGMWLAQHDRANGGFCCWDPTRNGLMPPLGEACRGCLSIFVNVTQPIGGVENTVVHELLHLRWPRWRERTVLERATALVGAERDRRGAAR